MPFIQNIFGALPLTPTMIWTFACFVNVRVSGPAQDGNDMC